MDRPTSSSSRVPRILAAVVLTSRIFPLLSKEIRPSSRALITSFWVRYMRSMSSVLTPRSRLPRYMASTLVKIRVQIRSRRPRLR